MIEKILSTSSYFFAGHFFEQGPLTHFFILYIKVNKVEAFIFLQKLLLLSLFVRKFVPKVIQQVDMKTDNDAAT